ncbi:MAG: hypothetical protein UDO44_03915 [Prevotella sp.]|nr:hypothetical protein [Prevotella sp.]
MTRVIHIDEPHHSADKSTLFACYYLSLILLVTMLHPSDYYTSSQHS